MKQTKNYVIGIRVYKYENGHRTNDLELWYATTDTTYSITDNIDKAKRFTLYMAQKITSVRGGEIIELN